jgi:hypothetical protein
MKITHCYFKLTIFPPLTRHDLSIIIENNKSKKKKKKFSTLSNKFLLLFNFDGLASATVTVS